LEEQGHVACGKEVRVSLLAFPQRKESTDQQGTVLSPNGAIMRVNL